MKETTLPGYMTITEAAAHLGISKTATSKAAKKENWACYEVGNVTLIEERDIYEYRDHRLRTRLVKSLGWSGRGLYRDEDIDAECPACGGFAIDWPEPPELTEKMLCVNGHKYNFIPERGFVLEE